jgi:hypothetical protein
MNTKTLEIRNGRLSDVQMKAFEKFRRQLKKKVPDYVITWVRPYNKSIIEVGYEPQKKLTYRKSLQAAKLAIEIGDKTGVTIILM